MTTPSLRPATRSTRALLAAFVGHAVEWYEFAVFGALAGYLALAVFPTGDRVGSLLLTWTVFAVAFLVRPIGGIVLSGVADRRGRKAALFLSVLLMSAATAGIGLLPGAAAIGVAAPALFIGLRMLQGFAVGGEMSSAVPYVVESVPAERRVASMALLAAGTFGASMVGALTAAGLAAALGEEAMAAWGWRVPFLLAVPLGLAALAVRRRAPESLEFERIVGADGAAAAPLRTALRTQRTPVLVYLALAVGYNVPVSVALTGLFSEALVAGVPRAEVIWVTVGAYTGLIVAVLAAAPLSSRIGRRPTIAIGLAIACLSVAPAVLLARTGSALPATLGAALFAISAGVLATPLYLALSEFFPVEVRSTSAALAFNAATALSSLVPATTLLLRVQLGFEGGLVLWVWAAAVPAVLALLVGWSRVPRVE